MLLNFLELNIMLHWALVFGVGLSLPGFHSNPIPEQPPDPPA